MSVNVKLSIPNISCHHCTNTIKRETEDLPGVEVNGGLRTRVNPQAEEGCSALGPPEGVVGGMKRHERERIESVRDRARAADVIEVRVGIEDGYRERRKPGH